MRTLGFAAATIVLLVSPASAQPETYACILAGERGTIFEGVDQIILDGEAQTFELRVARTMGTRNEINWIFQDGGTEDDVMLWRDEPFSEYGAGIRAGVPFVFRRAGGYFGLGFGEDAAIKSLMWSCTG